MNVVGHLDQFEHTDVMTRGINTKNGKENQMVSDGIEEDSVIMRSLVAVAHGTIQE